MGTIRFGMAVLALAFVAGRAQADVITDWNDKACAIVGKAGGGATGHRMMAVVQVAVFEAVNSIEPRYTSYMGRKVAAPAAASVDAAVAAANRATLLELGMKVGGLVTEKFAQPVRSSSY